MLSHCNDERVHRILSTGCLQQLSRSLRKVAIDIDDTWAQQAESRLGQPAMIAPELANRTGGRDERGAIPQPAKELARNEVSLPERNEEAGIQNHHV